MQVGLMMDPPHLRDPKYKSDTCNWNAHCELVSYTKDLISEKEVWCF